MDSLEPDDVTLGEPLFRSWIKLAGVLPFDYDDLVLVRIDPGEGFLERSTMFSQRSWEHERTLRDSAGGCQLTDRIVYEPRVAANWRLLVAHRFGHAAAAPTVHGTLKLLDEAGIEGELAVREVREGRVEVTQMWGRPQSVRDEFKRSRAQ